jgi:hypothetical protein
VKRASIKKVRLGHGANCSSIGSVVDTLFVSAVVGGAVFAAVMAAMKAEPVRLVGSSSSADEEEEEEDDA